MMHAALALSAVAMLLQAGGCAANHQIDDGSGISGGGMAVKPTGTWLAASTGSFQILPATQPDTYTLMFSDKLRPRLTLRQNASGLSGSGSQTNALQRESVDYRFVGVFKNGSITGDLSIVKKRSPGGLVFSTQTVKVIAVKQRHETASN
ncbi:hypothetical protein IT575_14250 [bacterium]|nr:hypothetical protein [bacterium]